MGSKRLKYSDIEGLAKKNPFKKGIIDLLEPLSKNLLKYRLKIVPESLHEPAALIDFLDYDFYLAFKTDGIGTKSLIADKMAATMRQEKNRSPREIIKLYAGLGIDLIASNVNDLICLGATPIAISDEIAMGDYHKFLDQELVKGLYTGLKKGSLEAGITIPCGESPTQVDIIYPDAINVTASAIGIVRPKSKVVLGQDLAAGDAIFALLSNGIHTNGLSLARKIVQKLPKGYFTKFGRTTVGEELLKPTRIYVKPVLEMLNCGVKIHYMSNISGSAFRKIARAQKDLTYVIEKIPKVPGILKFLQNLEGMPDREIYETWNMGLGFVIFAPPSEESLMARICRKYKVGFMKIGYVTHGRRQVIIKPNNIVF
ncbi:MAG: phosphoribosylformylglycinamidine cyclo-ligase [Candidatus Blackburnbacteria bacterium]|nr:phosphoribosylformylglycinamidine cyclo-ligase [Candidatus Blackburnbacteria bacterium]